MKKISFIILLFILNLESYSQNEFNTYFTKAQIWEIKKDLKTAGLYYDSALAARPDYGWCSYNAGICYIQLKNYKKATKLFKNSVLSGQGIDFNDTASLGDYINSSEYRKLKKQYPSLITTYKSELNDELICDLKSMRYADQLVRGKEFMNFFKDTTVFVNNRNAGKVMSLVDSLNFENLIKLTQKYGFPTKKNAGSECYIAHLLLWHHRGPEFYENPLWIKIKPFIQKEIEAGNIEIDFWTMFEDSYRYYTNKPMKYGVLINGLRFMPDYKNLNFENPEKINEVRKEVGLESIELLRELMGKPLPDQLEQIYGKK